jgi:hypothetical protein
MSRWRRQGRQRSGRGAASFQPEESGCAELNVGGDGPDYSASADLCCEPPREISYFFVVLPWNVLSDAG